MAWKPSKNNLDQVVERLDAILQAMSGVQGGVNVRLVSFLTGSKKVWINPAEVQALEETAPLKTKIHLIDGPTFTVDEAHDSVADKLAEDTQ